MRFLRLVALLLLPLPLLGWSCDRGTLTLHLVRSPDSADEPLPDPEEAIAAGRTPEVVSLRIRVEGGGMGLVEETLPFSGRGGRAELPDIPTGSHRVVSVEGLGPTGLAYSRGTSLPLEIRPGKNYLNLYIGRVSRFSAIPIAMREARAFHAAVVLPDSRLVLIGGTSAISRQADEPLVMGPVLATAEVLDATSASFDDTPLDCAVALPRDCLRTGRALATATALPAGVLVAGGEDEGGPLADAELFDPGRRLFSPGGDLSAPRSRHAAAAQGTGAVLFGGRDASGPVGTSAVFSDGRFSAGPAMTPREAATATVLADGRVLVAGGRDDSGELATVELYDGSAIVGTGSLLQPRAFHTASLLGDGRVLFLGGLAAGTTVSQAEVYDPATGVCAPVEAPLLDRWAHAATTMPDGRILVTGGFGGGTFGGARREAEIVDARGLQLGTGTLGGLAVTRIGGMQVNRAGHSASLLGNRLVLVAGGVGLDDRALLSAEVFVID
jgi:hypothetical protein